MRMLVCAMLSALAMTACQKPPASNQSTSPGAPTPPPAAAPKPNAAAVLPQQPAPGTIPVTADNFIRAETDLYFNTVAIKEGGFGKFQHHREMMPVDDQNQSGPTATRFMPRRFSTLMRGRSR